MPVQRAPYRYLILIATASVWQSATALAQDAAAVVAPPSLSMVEVSGQVVDELNRPVADVGVFAVEVGSPVVSGFVRSDGAGGFRMSLPQRRYDLGLLSSQWLLVSFRRDNNNHARISVRQAFPGGDVADVIRNAKGWLPVGVKPRGDPGDGRPVGSFARSIGVLEGMVVDETDLPVGGVRVLALDAASGKALNVTLSDATGKFSLATRAGANRLIVFAPGLKLTKGKLTADTGVHLCVGVDAGDEQITIRPGRVVSFRMDNSLWPEILPPPEVRAVLSFEYGIDVNNGFCPGDLITSASSMGGAATFGITCRDPVKCPASAWQRQCKIPKYWWLRVLQNGPPPPTTRNRRWWADLIREMQINEANRSLPPKSPPKPDR